MKVKVASKLQSTIPGHAALTGAQSSLDPLQFQPFQDVTLGRKGGGKGGQGGAEGGVEWRPSLEVKYKVSG